MSSKLKLIAYTALASLPILAVAQTFTKLKPPAPGAGSTLKEFIDLLIDIIQAVVLPLLVLFIIYSAYKLATAGGNEAEVTKGKHWILGALVGAAIILGAHVIADMIFGTAKLFY